MRYVVNLQRYSHRHEYRLKDYDFISTRRDERLIRRMGSIMRLSEVRNSYRYNMLNDVYTVSPLDGYCDYATPLSYGNHSYSGHQPVSNIKTRDKRKQFLKRFLL